MNLSLNAALNTSLTRVTRPTSLATSGTSIGAVAPVSASAGSAALGPEAGQRITESNGDLGGDAVQLSPESLQNAENQPNPTDSRAQVRQESREESETVDDGELTESEQDLVRRLQDRDREVRAHEQAHLRAAGSLANGPPQYDYQRGPDGKLYAVGGSVSIDVSPEPDPQDTIQKADRIKRAALAPAEPSSKDRQVASQADRLRADAQRELSAERLEEARASSGEGEERAAATTEDTTTSDSPEVTGPETSQATPEITAPTATQAAPEIPAVATPDGELAFGQESRIFNNQETPGLFADPLSNPLNQGLNLNQEEISPVGISSAALPQGSPILSQPFRRDGGALQVNGLERSENSTAFVYDPFGRRGSQGAPSGSLFSAIA